MKYPWKSYHPLRTHDFNDGAIPEGRKPPELFICRNCHRTFRYDADSRRTWAVAKDARSSALVDTVNARWLAEVCKGSPSDTHQDDARRIKTMRRQAS